MGIVDLFRPKHRHSNVTTRIQAVRAMGKDDSSLLLQVARTDRDPGVRRVALEKIEEAESLAELAASEGDPTLRDLAGTRAADLWMARACGADVEAAGQALTGLSRLGQESHVVRVAIAAALPQIRRRAMAELRDPKAIAMLAKQAEHHETRLAAVARIDNPQVLRALAVDTTNKELGLAAVERIDEPELLLAVANKAKNKAVRQRARKIAAEMQAAEATPKPQAKPVGDDDKRRQAEKAQLLREMESLVESHDFQRAAPRMQQLESTYVGLPPGDASGPEARMDNKALKLVRRFAFRSEASAAAARTRESTAAPPPVAAPEPAPVPVAAVDHEAALAAEAERQKATAARRAEHEAHKARRQAEAELREARQKERAAKSEQLRSQFLEVVAAMEGLLAAPKKKGADRVLDEGRKLYEQLKRFSVEGMEDAFARYEGARAKLLIDKQEAREVQEWQRYANVPHAEALLREVMALAESEEPDPDLGKKLKDAQARWKRLGALPAKASKELWELFKETCDVVYDKVRQQRAADEVTYAEVAAKKDAWVIEAESLSQSSDWHATSDRLKQLQLQWKEARLPRRLEEPLWQRFRAACDAFFARRQPLVDAERAERERNLAAKQEVCERIEALVASAPGEGGWSAAIAEARRLQESWRDTGHVARRDIAAIYDRYRRACDSLYAKRDASRDEESMARRAAVDGVAAKLESVIQGTAPDVVVTALEARSAWHDLIAAEGERMSSEPRLRGLFEAMVRHLAAHHANEVRGTVFDPATIARAHEKLIVRAEQLVPGTSAGGAGVSADADPADVATALRTAIAANAFAGLRFGGRDPEEAVEELRSAWEQVGPDLGEDGSSRRARFDQVCNRALGRSEAAGDSMLADGRRRSLSDPPPLDDLDTAWGMEAESPQPAYVVEGDGDEVHNAPSAGEMAADGATEGEGLDTGWD